MKRSLTLAKFLALAMAMLMLVAVVASCAQPGDDDVAADTTTAAVQDPNTPADTNNPGDETTAATAETEPPYEYADVNYGGADFMILNAEDRYNMIYHITIDDITGDKLEDERYAVNADIQDQYGIVIKETAIPYADIQVYAQNDETLQNICALFKKYDMYDYGYMTLKEVYIEKVRAIDPEIEICATRGWQERTDPENIRICKEQDHCRFVQPILEFSTEESFELIRKLGMRSNVFCSDDPAEMLELQKMGAHGILTNKAHLMCANRP